MKRILRFLVILLTAGTLHAQSTLQAILNVSDPQLEFVDFYVSTFGVVLLTVDNWHYRQTSATVPVPLSGIPLDLGLADSSSTALTDTIRNFRVTLEDGKNYFAVGSGVANPAQFAPNPDGKNTFINPFFIDNRRLVSSTPGQVEVRFVNSVTDAPTVDLRVEGGQLLADNISYGEYSDSNYVTLAPANYVFELTDQTGSTVLAKFSADLTNFADSALVIVSSGFMDPAANQNGAALALLAADRSDSPTVFPRIVVGIGDDDNPIVTSYRLEQNYPNPFNPSTTIAFALPNAGQVKLAVYDITGKLVDTIVDQPFGAGLHQVKWEAGNFSSGVYFYRLETKNFTQTRKLMLLK